MRPTQEQLQQQLAEIDKDVSAARTVVASLKKQLMDAETVLIGANISRSKILEQMRILRNETVDREITDRQEDIERFKKLLPDLLKTVK